MLVDPGASYPEYSGTETFKVTATYGNAPVSTAGWTFTILGPGVATPTWGISINAAAGNHRRLLLRGEHMARQHRRHHSEHASLQPRR